MRKEILDEIVRLEEEVNLAEKEGMPDKASHLRQRRYIARSYLILAELQKFQKRTWYRVEGTETRFYVNYIHDIFAWGKWEGSSESVPTLLGQLDLDELDEKRLPF